jgi:RHS repeat-associated protein
MQWHIRGGLRGINLNPAGNPIPDMTKGDLFAYKLEYETAGQWNGNIGRQSWNHIQGTEPVGVRNYQYTFDSKNQIKSAIYSGLTGENYSIPNVNYDKNGNITQLQRNGKMGGSFGMMDNLTYTYNGNRLTSVNDAISGNHEVDFVKRGSGAYTYYGNGALKSDENEQITNITYNTFFNQPEQVTLSDGRWIKHTYDGSGTLIKTEYSTGEYWEFTPGIVFKNGQFYQMATPEGRASYEGGAWKREFDYKDHLGNTRVSFKADGNRLVHTAKTDTDPWGVILKTGYENNFQNRFEMQGKESEKTFGLNIIRFGARNYNPTIGRWDRSDNKAEKGYMFSSYNYNFNNPINNIDPDGNWPWPTPSDFVNRARNYVVNKAVETAARVAVATANYVQEGVKEVLRNTEIAVYGKVDAKLTTGAGGAAQIRGLGVDQRYRHVELLSGAIELDSKKGGDLSGNYANKNGEIKEISTSSTEFVVGGAYTLETVKKSKQTLSTKTEIDGGFVYGAAPTNVGVLPIGAGVKISRETSSQGSTFETRGEFIRTGAKVGTPFTLSFDASMGIRATYKKKENE